MYFSKTGRIMMQVAGWLLFASLVVSFVSELPDGRNEFPDVFSLPFLVFFFLYISLFYINVGFLIPQLYLRKKYGLYFIIAALLLVLVYLLQPFDGLMSLRMIPLEPSEGPPDVPFERGILKGPSLHPRGRSPRFDITSIILFVTIWSLGMVLQIVKQWRNTEQRAAKAEAEKATAELSFLKAQIHPHFLFNTLNNIYSMAVLKHERTADAILKLSNIMRYVTDEVKRDFVSLEEEVAYISDYIDLQRIRLSNKVKVDFAVSGNPEGKQIAPLILMTFVENVFKYGISVHENSVITIKLEISEKKISFFCQNRLLGIQNKVESTGIGITNTRERLRHLYPGKHTLNIDTTNGSYTVHLTLQVWELVQKQ
jgi:two-component system, LytTR family, sensor kinase